MTTRHDFDPTAPEFDRLMTAWFEAEARVHEPDDLLERTISRRKKTRPRPAWLLPERWIPMELTMRRVRLPRATPYLALLAIVILLAVMALAIVGSRRPVPTPFGPAANGVLAFVTPAPLAGRGDASNGDIATVDPTTGRMTTIVGGPESDRSPAFSRDGTRIAFIRKVVGGDEVFTVDALGGDLVRVTHGPMASIPGPVWSPDGSRLAFVSLDRLWIGRTDGSGATRVDTGDITAIVELAWRPPDGRALVFIGTQDGKNRVFMIDPDGTDLQRIGQFDGGRDDGQWLTASPDGRRVAYGAYPAKQVHIVTIDDGIDQVVAPDDGIGLNFPRFSPDGGQLAVLHVPDGNLPTTHVGVFPVDDLSPHLTLLEPSFTGGVQFEWSPDGTTIVANQWGGDETWLLDPTGGDGTRMTWRASFDWMEWQRLAP